ncbi:ATP-binding protein [Nocardiopsis trehalosi]|uniref:ATP-binding protein n=1 Tax=Nocardiopsis trehalosi TaxID=109329 RepID=UPI000830F814|nr:BTAD domain-containing putative transcriptional regulator [Nocardiopsis trehalosi]
MRFSILGPLTVHGADGRPLAIGGARLRRLLTLLLLTPGRTVGTTRLIDGIWADATPSAAGNALQALASRLRRTLGDAAPLHGDATGYRLDVDHAQIDLFAFEDLLRRGRQARADGDPHTAARLLGEALALWRGPALADLPDSGGDVAVRLDESRRGALLDRLAAQLDLGRHAEAVPEIEALVAREPLDERPADLLIRALAADGRQADAVAAYERLRAGLADELGIDPSARLRALHLSLLRGELAPGPPADPPAGPPAEPASEPRTPPTRLPTLLTSFVARDDEVRRAVDLLTAQRLVTLVGPGGAGKTRLSIATGFRMAERHPALVAEGVWFVELAPVNDGADIPHAVLSTLGLREGALMSLRPGALPAGDVVDRITASLGSRRLLLVLDNCEHLVADAARFADRLLAACPGVRVLATSREPLALSGERLLAVPSLELPPEGTPAARAADYAAVRLFTDRVGAVAPGFTVDQDNVDHVVRICRELDGMPLALELAAARVRAMPVARLAAGLSDRFRLLTNGTRFALPRHRTLEAVVDWSWDLLDDPERALLRRLAVFGGGATLEAVERVCADDASGRLGGRDVWAVLFALVDKSLVVADLSGDEPEPRYRMLETVRAYGTRRLAESGEDPRVRRAHADHQLTLWSEAEPHLRGADQLDWLARLRAEQDDFAAAVRWAVDNGEAGLALDLNHAALWYWQMVDGWSEAARWSADILRIAGDRPPPGREAAYAECLFTVATCAFESAVDPEPGVRRADEVLRAAGEVPESYPTLLLIPAFLAMFGHDREEMLARLDAARGSADPWLRAAAATFAGLVHLAAGTVAPARDLLTDGLAGFRALGDRWGTCQALMIVAELVGMDDPDRERELLTEGVRLVDELGLKEMSAVLRGRRALNRAARGEIEAARRDLAELRGSERREGGRLLLRIAEAEVERHAGEAATARELLLAVRAEVIDDAPGMVRGQLEPVWRVLLARTAADLGDRDEARAQARAGWRGLNGAIAAVHRAQVLECLAQVVRPDHPRRAGVLLGAADGLRGVRNSGDPDVARTARGLAADLGAEELARACAEGAALAPADLDARVAAWTADWPDAEDAPQERRR